jgi:PAS domain-containing protein
VAEWRDGQIHADGIEPLLSYPLADDPLSKLCIAESAEPMLLTDLEQRLAPIAISARKCCEGTVGGSSGCKAMALLPLRSKRYSGWQGLLICFWTEPHSFSPEESTAYRMLRAILGMCIGGLRSEHELGSALTEAALRHEVTKQLNIALTLEEVLRALILPAPIRDEAEVSLCAIEPQPDGTPGWLRISSMIDAAGKPVTAQTGARYFLPDIPFSKLYMSSPDAPLLIGDIEHDPRVDEYARRLYGLTQCRATIVMALTLQGRWVGLFNVTWKRTVALGEREQRLYEALAKQAALLLDNSLMLGRLRASLHEIQRQGALLQTILDHMPVGVVLIEAHSARPVLGNACLERMLGCPLDKEAPIPIADAVGVYRFVKPDTEVLLPEEELAANRAMCSGKTETAEMDIVQATGDRLHAEANAVPIFDEHGAVKQVVVLLSDLTTRRHAEQERAQLQQEVIRVQASALAERSSPLIPDHP